MFYVEFALTVTVWSLETLHACAVISIFGCITIALIFTWVWKTVIDI